MNRIDTKSFSLAVYARGDEKASRIALLLPGRLDTKDYPHMRSHADFLAEQGFFALSFDPPGTWESSGDIGLYTMTNYLKAINELIEHFGNKPTLLMGHSRGGSMAMLGANSNPHVTHFVAVMAPTAVSVLDPSLKPSDVKISVRDVPGHPSEKKEYKLPLHFFEDETKYDMLEELKTCKKPKLFIAGNRDTKITPKDVAESYEIAAEPKWLKTIDSDHDYRHHPHLIHEVNLLVGDFLQKSGN